MRERGLIIFVKNPQLGKVKTRIEKTEGAEKALSIYNQLLQITRSVTLQIDAERYVYYTDFIDEDDLWTQDLYQKRLQAGGDLGAKMSSAIIDQLAICKKVVLIGSDCADLLPSHIDEAYTLLDDADVVTGPTHDGGYYLIGMKSPQPRLFENIPWSTSLVLKMTKEKATLRNLKLATLPMLSDIDFIEDWHSHLVKK